MPPGIGKRYNDPSIGHIRLEDPRSVVKGDPRLSKSIWLNEAMARKVANEAIRQGVDPIRAEGHLWYESLGGKKRAAGPTGSVKTVTPEDRYVAYVNPLHVSAYAHPDVERKYDEIGERMLPSYPGQPPDANFLAAKSFAKARTDSQNLFVGAGIGIMKDLVKRFGPERATGFYKGIGPEARTYGRELNTEMMPYLRSHPDINRIIDEERIKLGR
jgi:hypothetical protein